MFFKKIDISHLLYGHKINVNIFEVHDSEDTSKHPLSFTMKCGEKFLVFESSGKLCVEEKKRFFDWKTKSGFDVNPHKNMRKNMNACKYCPF